MKVTLSTRERRFLLSSVPISDRQSNALRLAKRKWWQWIIDIDDDDAEEIRELCEDKMQEIGFDRNYWPTRTGRILESLIDKFFTG